MGSVHDRHPYLTGNFAPIERELPLTACSIVGELPDSLAGGQYIRNGSNPVHALKGEEHWKRQYHWFDGDGMLSGVFFGDNGECWFVNKLLITDVLLASEGLSKPLLPSIATLVSPTTSLHTLFYNISRSFFLCIGTHLTSRPLRSLSVANTSILFHSRRALAWCESGPPLEVRLPELDTVGWFTWKQRLRNAAGERQEAGGISHGGKSMEGFFQSWTAAHPHVDPVTGEMMMLHPSFLPPYLRYTVISPTGKPVVLSAPIPLQVPKMMHDFAATATHTIILDLPLVFTANNLLQGKPILHYDRSLPSRFGIVPRYMQGPTRWFEDEPCVVFHCANAWDSVTPGAEGEVNAINLLCCRFQTDVLVFSAGNLALPSDIDDPPLLHYFRFPLGISEPLRPSHSFTLLSIPFEFPSLPPQLCTRPSRFVFGCSMLHGSFTAALGRASKIDCIVRVDVLALVELGLARGTGKRGPVDRRTMDELLRSEDADDPVRVFRLPPNYYAQEACFVPSSSFNPVDKATHADGHLLFYVFDESQLLSDGSARPDAQGELWVLDARDMRSIVARVHLPQRVPYGLHGSFVTREQIASQLPDRPIRSRPSPPSLPSAEAGGCLRSLRSAAHTQAAWMRKQDPGEVLLQLVAAMQLVLGLALC